MNHRPLILFVLAAIIFQPRLGVGQITFNQTYDNWIDGTNTVLPLDSGYLFPMSAGQPVLPVRSCFVKTNLSGVEVLQKCYGDSFEFHIFARIVETFDNNFISGAYSSNFQTGSVEIKIFKLNIEADTIWTSRYYPPLDSSYLVGGLTLLNNNILLSGVIIDNSNTNPDPIIVNIDSLGNLVWISRKSNPLYEVSSSIVATNSGFLTLGFQYNQFGDRNMALFKWDSIGNYLSTVIYGGGFFDGGYKLTKTSDGDVLLAGFKGFVNHNIKGWIIKTDTSGGIIWQYLDTASTSEFYYAKETINKDIVAAGSKKSSVTGYDEGYIIMLDSAGNLKWQRSFTRGGDHCYFRDVVQTSDGGFICAGFVFEGPDSTQDAWLVKVDSLGCDSVGCALYVGMSETIHNQIIANSYPNPASEFLNISLPFQPQTNILYEVFDINSRLQFSGESKSTKYLTISTLNLKSGLYIARVQFEKQQINLKFLVEKLN